MQEIEIKLQVPKVAALRRRLPRLGFRPLGHRLLERNLVFDTPAGSLRNAQRLLRLRSKGGRWWLTFKSRPEIRSRHKVREEIEMEIPAGEPLVDILGRLGFQVTFEYQKYRSEFQQPGGRGKLLLDETPIGNFMELEGPPRWIDRMAADLGYGSLDYILESYSVLYLNWCRDHGIPPGNMVFARPRGIANS